MSKKRNSRSNIDQSKVDILKPLDIMSLGTEKDPCFGKHHSLTAPECLSCGDSEFCSIVTAQNLHKKRLSIEADQKMKDLDEAEEVEIEKIKAAKVMLSKFKEKGYKRMKSIIKVSESTKLTKDKVKELYNQI